MVREKNIVEKILRELRKIPESHWRKTHGDMFNPGEPDISGCIQGRRVEIEVKRPGNKSTAIQLARQKDWRDSGACVITDATSWEETQKALAEQGLIDKT